MYYYTILFYNISKLGHQGKRTRSHSGIFDTLFYLLIISPQMCKTNNTFCLISSIVKKVCHILK